MIRFLVRDGTGDYGLQLLYVVGKTVPLEKIQDAPSPVRVSF